MATRELTTDELSALEDQRDFLLRSIDDLDAEHDVGDVDEHDYEVLREDYVTRAARVIRTIEAHQARVPEERPGRRWRTPAILAAVVVFAVGAGVLVARTSGLRRSGDTATGDIRTTTRTELSQAKSLTMQGQHEEAIPILEDILEEQPDNVEAAAFLGRAQVWSGDLQTGVATLTEATRTDPEYATAHAFLAETYVSLAGEEEATAGFFQDRARRELSLLEDLELTQPVEALAEQLRAELE